MEPNEGEDAADTELLERARRLCLAASQIEMPALPSFAKFAYLAELASHGGDNSEQVHETVLEKQAPHAAEYSRGSSGESAGSNERSQDKLPAIASTVTTVKPKRIPKKKADKVTENLSEEARRHAEERKKSKERDVEHARHRARARVARTNQQEQQEVQRKLESQKRDAIETAKRIAENIRTAKESRLRAEERIRVKCQARPPGRPPSAVRKKEPPTKLLPASGKLESFHRKTVLRLQRTSKQRAHSEKGSPKETCERNEAAEEAQRDLERRVRLQTTKRLRRMQRLEEDQHRKEREEFEQGLQRFKKKQQELNCIAKGLGHPQRPPPLSKLPIAKADNSVEALTDDGKKCNLLSQEQSPGLFPPNPSHAPPATSPPHEDDESSDSSDSDCAAPPTAPKNEQSLPAIVSSMHSPPQRRKLPAWKQPPVPVLPSECYLSTATVSGAFQTYRTRATTSGKLFKRSPYLTTMATPAAPGSADARLGNATRLRAKKIAKNEASLPS